MFFNDQLVEALFLLFSGVFRLLTAHAVNLLHAAQEAFASVSSGRWHQSGNKPGNLPSDS